MKWKTIWYLKEDEDVWESVGVFILQRQTFNSKHWGNSYISLQNCM